MADETEGIYIDVTIANSIAVEFKSLLLHSTTAMLRLLFIALLASICIIHIQAEDSLQDVS